MDDRRENKVAKPHKNMKTKHAVEGERKGERQKMEI